MVNNNGRLDPNAFKPQVETNAAPNANNVESEKKVSKLKNFFERIFKGGGSAAPPTNTFLKGPNKGPEPNKAPTYQFVKQAREKFEQPNQTWTPGNKKTSTPISPPPANSTWKQGTAPKSSPQIGQAKQPPIPVPPRPALSRNQPQQAAPRAPAKQQEKIPVPPRPDLSKSQSQQAAPKAQANQQEKIPVPPRPDLSKLNPQPKMSPDSQIQAPKAEVGESKLIPVPPRPDLSKSQSKQAAPKAPAEQQPIPVPPRPDLSKLKSQAKVSPDSQIQAPKAEVGQSKLIPVPPRPKLATTVSHELKPSEPVKERVVAPLTPLIASTAQKVVDLSVFPSNPEVEIPTFSPAPPPPPPPSTAAAPQAPPPPPSSVTAEEQPTEKPLTAFEAALQARAGNLKQTNNEAETDETLTEKSSRLAAKNYGNQDLLRKGATAGQNYTVASGPTTKEEWEAEDAAEEMGDLNIKKTKTTEEYLKELQKKEGESSDITKASISHEISHEDDTTPNLADKLARRRTDMQEDDIEEEEDNDEDWMNQ